MHHSLQRMSWALLALCLTVIVPGIALSTTEETEESYKTYGAPEARKMVRAPKQWITADHSKHEALKKDFQNGPEVTRACLSCHNEAGNQLAETIHWTWVCPADPTGNMGKAGLTLNNF
ncbi:MAG: hypothetical protein ACOC24_05625 [Desulfovibrionales bacterium]